jgi:hypothetical protein
MTGLKLVACADDERACALDSNAKTLVRKIKNGYPPGRVLAQRLSRGRGLVGRVFG